VNAKELEEIGHTGGTVTFHVVTGLDGRRSFQVQFHHQRPNAATWWASVNSGLGANVLAM
jgi:hypothetical protein